MLGAPATGGLGVLGRDDIEVAGTDDGRTLGREASVAGADGPELTGATAGLDEGRVRSIGCESVGKGGGRPRSEGGGGRTDTRRGGGVGK